MSPSQSRNDLFRSKVAEVNGVGSNIARMTDVVPIFGNKVPKELHLVHRKGLKQQYLSENTTTQ